MRFLVVSMLLGLVACRTAPVDRAPAQHVHEPSAEFKAAELVPRQHSFIFLDPEGRFGYHVSEFNSNHQHQFIVRGKLSPNGASSGNARNGYFSVTSNMPRFLLSELISGARKKYSATVYDGLIITRPVKPVKDAKGNPLLVTYEIVEKLYESPMHTGEARLNNLSYIVFGSDGQAQKTHYLAHLIKGANNYEQLLIADFDQPQLIANGKILVLEAPDNQPLKSGDKVNGQIDGKNVTLSITKQVYFDKRNAEGFGDY